MKTLTTAPRTATERFQPKDVVALKLQLKFSEWALTSVLLQCFFRNEGLQSSLTLGDKGPIVESLSKLWEKDQVASV
jgi:hypothetical protein